MIAKLSYQTIRNYTFVDIEDVEVGSIEDMVLDTTTLLPNYLVLGAGFFEEYLETMGKKPNIDEVAELELMTVIEDSLILISKKLDELMQTGDDGSLPVDGIRYTDIHESPIHQNGELLEANVQDYYIDGQDSSLLIFYHRLHEVMQMEGYRQKFEFKIPVHKIKYTDQIIHFPFTQDYLIEKIRETSKPKLSGKTIIQL